MAMRDLLSVELVSGANAAEPTDGTHSEVGADHGGEQKGLPQLKPEESLFVSQLVWLAITFGFLYVMMARFALPKIATVIEERRDKIALDLDQAKDYQQQTEDAIEAYETALQDARARANKTIEETRQRIKAEMDELRSTTEAELDTKLKAAEGDIEKAKQAALGNIRGISVELTHSILSKVSAGGPVPDALVASAVDAELDTRASA